MKIIEVGDLPASIQAAELIDAMVAAANAKASRVAPCLTSTESSTSSDQLAEARLVLIGAIKRWTEAGTGAFNQQTAGPFSVSMDTRQRTGYNFWPSEIATLQDICKSESDAPKAYSVDTLGTSTIHSDACALTFGANYCSCGADIAGEPIFGAL